MKMTLEQKCALLSGKSVFQTREYKNLGIPAIWLSDGPHGLRKQAGASDHLGLNPSVEATCFPSAATIVNSWDETLGEKVGEALGEETATLGVNVLLGPGLNMKEIRSADEILNISRKIRIWQEKWQPHISVVYKKTKWQHVRSILL